MLRFFAIFNLSFMQVFTLKTSDLFLFKHKETFTALKHPLLNIWRVFDYFTYIVLICQDIMNLRVTISLSYKLIFKP